MRFLPEVHGGNTTRRLSRLDAVDAIFLVKSLAPSVLVGIMRGMFKRLLPLACLGFSACGMMPGMNSGDGSGTASTDAPSSGSQTATTVVASTANAAAAVATAASNPTDANVVIPRMRTW